MQRLFFILLFIWLCLVSCQQVTQPAILYLPKAFQSDKMQQDIAASIPNAPNSIAFTDWHFASGSSKERLLVHSEDFPSMEASVTLPHRINLPNSALWYSRKIKLDTPKLLIVNADDGAQVFYNHQQIKQSIPNGFTLLPTGDSTRLIIRVLNNALQGGLRKVELMDLEDGLNYAERIRQLHLLTPYYDTLGVIFVAPFVQRLSERQYLIKAIGNLGNAVIMQYGEDQKKLNKKLLPSHKTAKTTTFLLEDLPKDRSYFYRFQCSGFVSPIFELRPPVQSTPFSFTAWGDSQGGWSVFQQLTKKMHQRAPAFTIGLGDLVANGSEEVQWLTFLYALQPLGASIPTFTLLGNHDYDSYYDDLIPKWYQHYIKKENYYAWNYNNCAFIALDPNEHFPLGIEGEQKAWFLAQLQSPAWQSADWRFLLIHQPPYSQGWEGYHGDEFVQQIMEQHAEAAKIDVVLSGHSHCYERLTKTYGKQKTHFFVLGGAGGELEELPSSTYPKMDKVIKKHHYGYFTIHPQHIEVVIVDSEEKTLDTIKLER